MTDISMLVYVNAKKDVTFLEEIKDVLQVPDSDDEVAKKAAFANAYAAWLIGKGRWEEFTNENEIVL